MAWSKFNALPNYLGGKRKLVADIFKHVPPASKAPVFVDVFMGGGSVALFAKARGHQIFANDISLRSWLTGLAFIHNSKYKIEEEDLVKLFIPIENEHFIEKNYSPKIFTTYIARFLDNAFAQIATFNLERQALLSVLMVKFMLSCRPFSHFTSLKVTENLESKKYEEAFKQSIYKNNNLRQVKIPLDTLRTISKKINKGVFSNGIQNFIRRQDALTFLKNQLLIAKPDIAYFDPPYPETSSYEETYLVLDSILAGEKIKPQVSEYSKKDAIKFLDQLFKTAKPIKDWVISMGQTDPEKGLKPEELLAVVRKYKPHAQMRLLKHAWESKKGKQDKSAECIEYVIYTYHG